MTASSPSKTDSPLCAESLSAGHDGRMVFEGLDLEIEPHCLTVLAGPNGSGKSTLLAALARLLPLRSGRVMLQGRDIRQMAGKEAARLLGLLPQQPVAPEDLTVEELVGRGRFPHQGLLRQWSREDEAAVAEALQITGTEDLAGRPVNSLSGGQRQRVWIAMVLAQQTGVILLDEPTSFLDLNHQVGILTMLQRLVRDHGRTVVCVLHDLNMALHFADRLVFLRDGAIRHRLACPAECSEAMVAETFGLRMLRMIHPQTGTPVFLPQAAAALEDPADDPAARRAG